jgi:hypothetical protein
MAADRELIWEREWPVQLQTRGEYENLPGVKMVRDCWPSRGHITLIVAWTSDRADINVLRTFVHDNKSANLIVHTENQHGYSKLELIA